MESKKKAPKASKKVREIIGDDVADLAEKIIEKVPSKKEHFKEPEEVKEVKKEVLEVPEVKVLQDSVPSHLLQTKDEYSVEVIKDFDGRVDPFFLEKKDPNYEYRFLYANDKNLSIKTGNLLYQKGGWQIVPRDHLVNVLKLPQRFINKEGVYRVGDTILARMPKKLYDDKVAYKQKIVREKTDRIKKMTEQGDSSVAGVGHGNMKGLQTKDNLRM